MKTLLLFLFVLCYTFTFGQTNGSEEILIDNEKMKVVKFIGTPSGDICGNGMHYHEEHLTVALSDAKVKVTPKGGEEQEVEIPKGAAIWFEEGTHIAKNSGNDDTQFLLVFLKE